MPQQELTLSQILPTVVGLEKQTMALYMRFARLFQHLHEVRSFWLTMARHEAGHIGALCLVEGALSNDPTLAQLSHDQQVQPPQFGLSAIDHLQSLLRAFAQEASTDLSIQRAFAMTIAIESSELEDVVVELLQLVKEERIRDQAVQLLIHDLSDLSYMIERYTQDDSLLAQADALVEHRLDTFSLAQPADRSEETPLA